MRDKDTAGIITTRTVWVRPDSEMAKPTCGVCRGRDNSCPYCCKVHNGEYIGPMERRIIEGGT
jgi:hypothetical protein